VIVDAAIYEDGKRLAGAFDFKEAGSRAGKAGAFAWVGLFQPTPDEFEQVREAFGLHPLAVEDAINAHQRPKLETYDNTLFIVLKPARYVDPVEVIDLGEILLFVDRHFAVVVRHGEAAGLVEVRKYLEGHPEVLAQGPGAVLHAVINKVVDDYFEVLDELDEDIQQLEESVFSQAATPPTERIYRVKSEVLQFNQATQPLIAPLERLAGGTVDWIPSDLGPYYRDVHDHLLRVVERIGHDREQLTSILEANLTQVNIRQNADMRKISAWVAIAAVPTALAGIWGMNFEHMPEIPAQWGYPAALGLMATACLFLYSRFKKSGWL
jgi:magnesium transporter